MLMSRLSQRLASIDVFRAFTMFMMIFVNDLWTLTGIPEWLEHTAAEADGMGLADTVFPAFLFIVGLSIPLAIARRQSRGASTGSSLGHILTRSLALLVMGVFHVNLENYNNAAAALPKPYWEILITIGFFLVWLDYSRDMAKQRKYFLQGTGVALLVMMAILFRGGGPDHPVWMRFYWWGILGLIGWSYLLSATVFLFSKDRLVLLIGALLFFLMFNIATDAGWLESLSGIRQYVWIVGDGSMPALTMAGVVTSVIYSRLVEKNKYAQSVWILMAIAAVMLIGGFALRPYWGISKIRATPSWVMICTAISIAFFVLLTFLTDVKKKQDWFSVIKPAGTSTLTCYLLPYIHYSLYSIIGISLPLVIRTGPAGIIKSLLYALVIILIGGWLEKNVCD